MRDEVRRRCELLIQNRDTLNEAFKWGSSLLNLSAAYMITSKEKHVDVTTLKQCNELLKKKKSVLDRIKQEIKKEKLDVELDQTQLQKLIQRKNNAKLTAKYAGRC